jgi:hypothetical protein
MEKAPFHKRKITFSSRNKSHSAHAKPKNLKREME